MKGRVRDREGERRRGDKGCRDGEGEGDWMMDSSR